MKTLEFFGTLLAAIGFLLLSENFYIYGFSLGLVSCFALFPVLLKNNLISLFLLQVFFACANINGILNNIG